MFVVRFRRTRGCGADARRHADRRPSHQSPDGLLPRFPSGRRAHHAKIERGPTVALRLAMVMRSSERREGKMARSPKFGVFVPQGWKMDLVEIDDPVEQVRGDDRGRQPADAERLRFDLGLRPFSHRPDADAGDDLRVLDDHRHAGARHRAGARSDRWSAATAIATPRSTPRSPRRSTSPAMAGCYAGIGAGWYEHEWRAYGYGFPDAPEPLGMFREALRGHPRHVDRTTTPRSRASITRSTARSTSRKARRSRIRSSGSAAAARR